MNAPAQIIPEPTVDEQMERATRLLLEAHRALSNAATLLGPNSRMTGQVTRSARDALSLHDRVRVTKTDSPR